MYNGAKNYMDIDLQEHDDLIGINSTGAFVMALKNTTCKDEIHSTLIPQYIIDVLLKRFFDAHQELLFIVSISSNIS